MGNTQCEPKSIQFCPEQSNPFNEITTNKLQATQQKLPKIRTTHQQNIQQTLNLDEEKLQKNHKKNLPSDKQNHNNDEITSVIRFPQCQEKNPHHKLKQKPIQNILENLVNGTIQSIPVPFSVICSILNENLKNLIKKINPNFFTKFPPDDCSFHLYKFGCYGLQLTQNYGIFLNKDYFYEGIFKRNFYGKFLPSERGTYISELGKYVGQFKDGKQHGQGKYYALQVKDLQPNLTESRFSDRVKATQVISQENKQLISVSEVFKFQTIYKGEWQNSFFVHGVIENYQFKFEGMIKNNKPNGFGQLFLKKPQTNYKGNFKDGLFDGEKSVYETPNYVYIGGFKNGKKNGMGILVKKLQNIKNLKQKFLVPERCEGFWKDDQFINSQLVLFKKQ